MAGGRNSNTHHVWNVPPSGLILADDEVHVWRVELDVARERVEELRDVLAADERERAARFYFERDRCPWIVARATLRLLLSRYTKVAPEHLTFSLNAYGKPSLVAPEEAMMLQFNLSHSQHRALYAFSLGRELGVDVEYMREGIGIDELSRHSFSPREQVKLQGLVGAAKQLAFFRCWTRKEAYIKARGMGLSLPLDVFDVAVEAEAALLASREDAREVERWSLHDIEVGDDYAGALAVEGSGYALQCWQWVG